MQTMCLLPHPREKRNTCTEPIFQDAFQWTRRRIWRWRRWWWQDGSAISLAANGEHSRRYTLTSSFWALVRQWSFSPHSLHALIWWASGEHYFWCLWFDILWTKNRKRIFRNRKNDFHVFFCGGLTNQSSKLQNKSLFVSSRRRECDTMKHNHKNRGNNLTVDSWFNILRKPL